MIELLANETLVYDNRYVKVYNWSTIQNLTTLKLGLILIHADEYSNFNHDKNFIKVLLDKKNKKEDIIWCNKPIVLKKER